MELRYTPTYEDSLNAMRATSQPAWTMFLFVLLLALMFLVGIYLVDHGLRAIGWVWLAVSAAMGIAVYQVPRMQLRRAIRSNPSAQGEIVLKLSDAGIDCTFPTGRTQLEWRAYTKYKETNDLFLMSQGRRTGFIPKRIMSPEQVQELRALLKKHIHKQTETRR